MRVRHLASLALVAVLQGCGRLELSAASEPIPEDATKGMVVRATCPASDAFDYYFPFGTIDESEPPEDRHSSTRSFSQQLLAMGESSMSCGAGSTSYRFTWLRSFHPAITVRLDVDPSAQRATLRAIELESAGGYSPGDVARVTQRALTKSELKKFLADVSESRLWSLHTMADEPPGVDGATWIIEMRSSNRYHVAYRWSPNYGPIYWRGLDLLELSGWQFKEVY